jgi:hypothetical protein
MGGVAQHRLGANTMVPGVLFFHRERRKQSASTTNMRSGLNGSHDGAQVPVREHPGTMAPHVWTPNAKPSG